ncbi:unnamed protein product [Brachionus calyciflorus]|uniref:Uncharacterized protein n=1 Tax=Brachionus calyciflorus TaxID=104777 RepID=A0A814K325_9BILA|nr:unnamed protein product [Brachionus calyciflorus]
MLKFAIVLFSITFLVSLSLGNEEDGYEWDDFMSNNHEETSYNVKGKMDKRLRQEKKDQIKKDFKSKNDRLVQSLKTMKNQIEIRKDLFERNLKDSKKASKVQSKIFMEKIREKD